MEPRSYFSRGGEYFASCSSEGELRIWDTKTSSLHQTFVLSHLRGQISCLAWSREKQSTRKRRSSNYAHRLHLGGGVGSKVIIWNLTTNEEQAVLTEHSDVVTCLDWDLGGSRLYSGSKDAHIVEWDVESATSTRKWKVDKACVQCVCCYGDGSLLLTAGRAIKVWSLEDYTVIKKVNGHATDVRHLCFVSKDSFLSSAASDRIINYWQFSSSGKSALATLTCEEEVAMFDCCVDDDVARVAVVSEGGGLFLYQFSLSPLPSSPLTCSYAIQFVNSPPKPSTPSPLPVLAALLPPRTPHLVTVAHTSSIKPSIETIEFEQATEHTCIVRDANPSGLLMSHSAQSSTRPHKTQHEPVTVLGPGNMTLPTKLPTNQPVDSQPLGARLDPEMKLSKGYTRSADSLTQLLVQSIASDDGKLLEEVLRVSKERIVSSTVRGLPVHTVLPFMIKLIELLQFSPARGLQLSLWIKTVLSSHAAYLMTVPQLSESFSGLHQLLESRVSTFSRLCHLQGKLDLMLAQGQAGDDGLAASERALNTPLVTIMLQENSTSGLSMESDAEEQEEKWSSGPDADSSEDMSMETDHSLQYSLHPPSSPMRCDSCDFCW